MTPEENIAQLRELNRAKIDRTRQGAIDQRDMALEGQSGGRRFAKHPIAYFISEEQIFAQGVGTTAQHVLNLYRWQSTGRASQNRLVLTGKGFTPEGTIEFEYGFRQVNGERTPVRWQLDPASLDIWCDHIPRDDQGMSVEKRREATLTPFTAKHGKLLNEVIVDPMIKKYSDGQRAVYKQKQAKALHLHMPSGFTSLPGATRPLAYKVIPPAGDKHFHTVTLAKATTWAVKNPEEGIGDSSDRYIKKIPSCPIIGTALLYGVEYHVAPDGKTLYRKGAVEDIYTYAIQNASGQGINEATMVFYENAPPNAPRVPGELAWYELDFPARIVRVHWYLSPTGEPMEDVVGMAGGTVMWRGIVYYFTIQGALVRAVP